MKKTIMACGAIFLLLFSGPSMGAEKEIPNASVEILTPDEHRKVCDREGLEVSRRVSPMVSMFTDQAGKNFIVHFALRNHTQKRMEGHMIIVTGNHTLQMVRVWPDGAIPDPGYKLITPLYVVPYDVKKHFKKGRVVTIEPEGRTLVGAWIPWPSDVVRAFTHIDIYVFGKQGELLLMAQKKWDETPLK